MVLKRRYNGLSKSPEVVNRNFTKIGANKYLQALYFNVMSLHRSSAICILKSNMRVRIHFVRFENIHFILKSVKVKGHSMWARG